jgi:hypothetical protein
MTISMWMLCLDTSEEEMTRERRLFLDGELPTPHQLRSALRTGRLIDQSGSNAEDLRSAYRLVPYGGLYRSDDLIVGEAVLIAAGVLSESDGVLVPLEGLGEIVAASDVDGCEALLVALLEHQTPLWLGAATGGGALEEDLIPDQARATLREALDPETREGLLLRLGLSYSEAEQARIGGIAETFVVTCCRRELRDAGAPGLADAVRRVSEVSDQLGYDITAPRLDRSTRRIEVKGTRSTGRSVFYLSRNEAERGLVDPNWALVVCRVVGEDDVRLVGHLGGGEMQRYLPRDACDKAHWQSVRVDVPEESFLPGLPPMSG